MNPLPDMTASASVLIVCTVILRAIFIHRLPKQTFTVLWLIAALRLLIPFSAPVNLGIPQPVHEAVYRIQTAEMLQKEPAQTVTASETEPDIPASADTGETGDAPQTGLDASQFALPLWLAGAGITLTVFLLRHRRVLRHCLESIPAHCPTADSLIRRAGIRRSVQVRVCQTLATPLTFGLIKPVILLPKSLDTSNPDRLSCILTHELVHIKRLHVLYKYILTLAVCVHWFNPLAWVMLLLANRDLELSCDQAVLSLSGSNRQSYALTLIAMEETRGLSPLSSGFGANAVEERIRSIMKYRKTGIPAITLSIVLVLGAVTAFATAEEFGDATSNENTAIEAEVDTVEMADTQTDDSMYTGTGSQDNTVTAMETTGALWDGQDLSDYSDFGISADHENQYYLYDRKPVAGFADIGHYVLTDSHAKDDGGIYVAAERSAWGKLTGIREISTEEFLDMTGLTM